MIRIDLGEIPEAEAKVLALTLIQRYDGAYAGVPVELIEAKLSTPEAIEKEIVNILDNFCQQVMMQRELELEQHKLRQEIAKTKRLKFSRSKKAAE